MDEKLWRENGNENFFEVCLVGWEGRKINGEIQVFFLWIHQKFSPQNREKTKERKWGCLMDKNAHMQLHMGFIRTLLFFTFFFSFLLDIASFSSFFSFFFLLIYWAGFVQCTLLIFFFFLFFFFCFLLFFIFYFCFWFRCDFFFPGHDIFFLINLGDFFFFTFLVLIWHYFLTRLCE